MHAFFAFAAREVEVRLELALHPLVLGSHEHELVRLEEMAKVDVG